MSRGRDRAQGSFYIIVALPGCRTKTVAGDCGAGKATRTFEPLTLHYIVGILLPACFRYLKRLKSLADFQINKTNQARKEA